MRLKMANCRPIRFWAGSTSAPRTLRTRRGASIPRRRRDGCGRVKRAREAIAGADIRFELATFGSAGELQPLWLDLEQRAATHVFLSWDWIGCWIEETAQNPLTIIGRTGSRIVL